MNSPRTVGPAVVSLAIFLLLQIVAAAVVASASRQSNVVIQILSSANGKGEIGECE